ncbi:MAG: RNA polymerase sigma factor [Polyangiaceae bacterium]|nr:RNA polymerase sigma factor [Polyangiaceae bacterium]
MSSSPARATLRSVSARAEVPVVGGASDDELVRRLIDSDPWAREAFYRKHFRVVFVTALRLLASRAEAEDVAQDAFIIAFRDIGSIRDPGAIGAWLLRIAVRQVNRRLRRRKMLRVLGFDSGIEDGTLEVLASNDAGPDVRADLGRLDRVLSELPCGQRVAWMLRRVDGHSLEEVAAACECSLATAKRRIRAADDHVRRHLTIEGVQDV